VIASDRDKKSRVTTNLDRHRLPANSRRDNPSGGITGSGDNG